MDTEIISVATSHPLIHLHDLHKIYQSHGDEATKVHALQGINLTIEAGEFVSIMGPSGSGKSTLLQILGLLDQKTSGDHRIDNVDVGQLNEDAWAELRLQKIGFVFQFFNLLPRTSSLDNVSLPLLYAGQISPHDRAKALLQQVGLGDRLEHKPHQLSGGQQQRVAIARALANSPRLILADEPTGNISSQQSEEILNMFDELNRQGTTIIIVTHESEVAHRARRLITIKDGKVFSDQVLQTPLVRFAQSRGKNLKADLELAKPPPSFRNRLFRLQENARMALTSLMLNKLRTGLATLGVVIGIASFMAMMAVGTGARKAIATQIESLGTNLLNVRATPPKSAKGGNPNETRNFTHEDFLRLKTYAQTLPSVRGVDAQVYGNVTVANGANRSAPELMGATPEVKDLLSLTPSEGRFFSEEEDLTRAKVALIGPTVARNLFGDNGRAVGSLIKLNRVDYEVIGVLPAKGANSFKDRDDIVIVPLRTALQRVLGRRTIHTITVAANSSEDLVQLQDLLTTYLHELRRLEPNDDNDFIVRNSNDVKELYDQTTRIITSMLQAIAAVSLLVGGIGIMNVMFVSVKERTREVGLRKALGGKKNDVLSQFLVESVLIGLLGGVFGILLGLFLASFSEQSLGFAAVTSVGAVAVSFSFSFLVGVVFGIWPARQASQLSPIEALRYE